MAALRLDKIGWQLEKWLRRWNGIAESSDEVSKVVDNAAETAPRFAMVARFSRQKDHATLLRAVALMKEDNFHLDLIGSGPLLAACQQLAKALDIEDKVSFWDDSYDVPIHLSKVDGFGFKSSGWDAFVASPDGTRWAPHDGRQKFLREFTLQKMLAETQTVYRQVLATAHPLQ